MSYTIKTLNKIASTGLERLGEGYTISDEASNPDAILLRSASMHEMEFPESLLSIARAGAGVNNIPIDKCAQKGIVVFNTPGANANAVKELAITSMLISSRKIIDGIIWANSLNGDVVKDVEKGKAQFIGPEIEGKVLGVIGLGAIGVLIANAAINLGMEVLGYDPYISVDAAWGLSREVKRANDLKTVFEKSDYITLHMPYNTETKGILNEAAFEQMKKGIRIINLSRGELVNDDDILVAIEKGIVGTYVTDFPNEKMINKPGVITVPHLGASTPESEDNCAVMAARQTKNYLETGNIKNSVNFPNCSMPLSGEQRITVAHMNVPNMVGQITTVLANASINIKDMINKSRGDYAYTILDLEGKTDDDSISKLGEIEGVLKVRVI
ncbi:MAG TPA: phosphoglycerate dehydrogenase [Niabella sp.]|nr:phosphoglycerate dehydrogenase [Niabella sp.]HQW14967.1 phosphoglycerate dehydrogenase [Niabella sp.]HQX20141.1 phosphoglycerate dehydrogenase [Niabella sp.]HRB06746.1 phosphoglycerate dehydrogenase [Niabella sp.]HRB27585.1 phosphoglycerate dehydrogenase [Niabella sp.]